MGFEFQHDLAKMKVKNLSLAAGTQATNTSVGPYIDSYQLQVLSEGYAPYMFYVYHQLYDEKTGKPVEGAYVDLDGNGKSTPMIYIAIILRHRITFSVSALHCVIRNGR